MPDKPCPKCGKGCVACFNAGRSAISEALQLDHRRELTEARMQLIVYRRQLVENGIEPLDESGQDLLDMWCACREVIRAAQECVANLGSAAELLEDWS